jgi:hypothetical protein
MKKLIALCALTAVLFSCQKEISHEDPNSNPGTGGGTGGGGSTTGTKLTRIGIKDGSDSITLDYTYTSTNKISSVKASGTENGQTAYISLSYTRNSANVITEAVVKSTDLDQYGATAKTKYTLESSSSSKYKYSVTNATVGPMSVPVDSTVYSYDASNRLASKVYYINTGSALEIESKEEYTYTGSNVTTIKYYSYGATGQPVLDDTETYTYDSKVNPLQFTADAPAMSLAFLYSALATYFSANNATNVSGTNISYIYNSQNKPVSASADGVVYTFYYQ